MSADDFYQAEIVAGRLAARDQLMAISACTYPTAKTEWQKKYHRQLSQQATPPASESSGPVLSTADLAAIMAGRS